MIVQSTLRTREGKQVFLTGWYANKFVKEIKSTFSLNLQAYLKDGIEFSPNSKIEYLIDQFWCIISGVITTGRYKTLKDVEPLVQNIPLACLWNMLVWSYTAHFNEHSRISWNLQVPATSR